MFFKLHDLPLEWKNCLVAVRFVFGKEKLFVCYMICPRKEKTFSLLYDMSLERKNVIVAIRYVPNFTLPLTLKLELHTLRAFWNKMAKSLGIKYVIKTKISNL